MTTQTAYALIYLEINLASILLIGLIRLKTRGLSKMVAQRNFSLATDAEMLCILSDAVYVMMERELLPRGRIAMMLAKDVYFFVVALMCFFWFIYFEYLQESPFVNNRKRIRHSSVLVWCMGALLIVNHFTGILFYVDDAEAYHRGPLFLLQYLLSYIYVFFTSFRALLGLFREQNYVKRKTLISLAFFPVIPAIAGIVQFFHPDLPMACVAMSLATLELYLDWVEQVISIDPLTRLNNRKQLSYHYKQWAQNAEIDIPLYLLLIDANKFKSINDTYGHIQGDAALTRIADAMRMACRGFPRRVNIARYGGDEFVILANSDDPEAIRTLCERINETLERLNREACAPYELSVSIGVARAEPSLQLKELIERADEHLYAEKKARRGG